MNTPIPLTKTLGKYFIVNQTTATFKKSIFRGMGTHEICYNFDKNGFMMSLKTQKFLFEEIFNFKYLAFLASLRNAGGKFNFF